MFEKFKIFDDIVPSHIQDYFEYKVFGKPGDLPLHPDIHFKVKYESTAVENDYYPASFSHILKSSTHLSDHFENFTIIPKAVCKKLNTVLQDIIVARMFIVVPYDTEQEHMKPHIDFDVPHTVVLYYLNDSDGDTLLYNKQGQIMKRVSPKKGRALVFDGSILHSGGIPKQGPRCAVNFNITMEKYQ